MQIFKFLVLLLSIINISAFANSTNRLGRDYEFIFFYSTDCQYCMKFSPVLKLYSDNTNIPVKAFVMGNGGVSPFFPNSNIVTQDVVDQFFSSGAKIAVPTLFILNKNNFHAYPVSSGALTYLELATRMNALTPKILHNENILKEK